MSTWSATSPMKELGQRSIEVRGLKVAVAEIDIPVNFGAAFEGERVRKEDIYLECGGGKTQAVELVTSKRMDEVEDGKVEVIGQDISDLLSRRHERGYLGHAGGSGGPELPARLRAHPGAADSPPGELRPRHHAHRAAGHRLVPHRRRQAVEKGFSLKHIGRSSCTPSTTRTSAPSSTNVQVKIYTDKDKVDEITARPAKSYHERDTRVENMRDETTETYYSCTLCQSFAPNHVCVVSPERTGLCGAYNWMDCKAAFEINPTGPNQPMQKGETLDERWASGKGVNEFVFKASRQKVEKYNFYSLV